MNPVVQLGQGVDGVSAWEQHDRQVSVMGPSVMGNLKVHLVRSGADVVEEEPVSDHPVETHGLFNVCPKGSIDPPRGQLGAVPIGRI